MILNVILWYILIALAGWLVFPLAFRVLAFLPDRGLAVSRALGLLLGGYAYWILVSLGILQNNLGGVFSAYIVLTGLSFAAVWGRWNTLLCWLGQRKRLVITTELLFLGLFTAWVAVRAANPDITSTEKPMELALINSILRSPVFPPADPWLSGYAISYYYFGYVIVAMLARLAAVPGSVAFNLGLASWFALTGLAAYGVLYNLLSARENDSPGSPRENFPRFAALLAPLFVLLVSNLEGFLEMLHARGLFWKMGEGGYQSAIWKWLNIQEINLPPTPPMGWAPERTTGIWWWRASRVLQDFDWSGQPREIIDEFPAFSYLLGDLHPHVLAMPFVLLAVAFSLNMYLEQRPFERLRLSLSAWVRKPEFWLCAVIFGGLSFLNTWDFPIYLALFAASAVLPAALVRGHLLDALVDLIKIMVVLGGMGILLYLPFYLGFASQANGLMPSLLFFTRGIYFWVMFGSLLIPILAWLAWKWRFDVMQNLTAGVLFGAGLVGGMWLLSSLYGFLRISRDPALAGIYGAPEGAGIVLEALTRRLQSPGTWFSLAGLLGLTWGLFSWGGEFSKGQPLSTDPDGARPTRRLVLGDAFVLLLILLGLGLILFPEFFYLRDQFGTRMNTIFKFYFQAWIVLAISAAYASAVLFDKLRWPAFRAAFSIGWTALMLMALAYPVFGIPDRAGSFQLQRWSLDGADMMMQYSPDELEAVRWLQQAPYGVVAEATKMGASYSGFARISTLSGLPTVLGWPGHEMQWRGGSEEIGTREPDIAQLYKARTWEPLNEVIEKYNIRYVYVGSLEQSQYRASDVLFRQYLKPVFERPSVTIYEAPRYSINQAQADTP